MRNSTLDSLLWNWGFAFHVGIFFFSFAMFFLRNYVGDYDGRLILDPTVTNVVSIRDDQTIEIDQKYLESYSDKVLIPVVVASFAGMLACIIAFVRDRRRALAVPAQRTVTQDNDDP